MNKQGLPELNPVISSIERIFRSRSACDGSSNLLKSCIALGVHKGGSTMLHDFIGVYLHLLSKEGINIGSLDVPTSLFNEGYRDIDFDDLPDIPEKMLRHPSSCFFGWRNIPISFFRYKPLFARIPTVCLVRDPRDCVVSAYYSFLRTHRLPEEKNSKLALEIAQERSTSMKESIDLYAIENIQRFTGELERVVAFLHPNLKLYRYEDIWSNREWFFYDVIEHLGLPVASEPFEGAYEWINIKPGSDPRGHVRKGDPGDHRAKLSLEVIDQITTSNADLLQALNYLP